MELQVDEIPTDEDIISAATSPIVAVSLPVVQPTKKEYLFARGPMSHCGTTGCGGKAFRFYNYSDRYVVKYCLTCHAGIVLSPEYNEQYFNKQI